MFTALFGRKSPWFCESRASGVRKARWGRQGKGKSGGVRVIFFYWISDSEVYLLQIYAKNTQDNLTAAEKKAARKIVEAIKHAKEEQQKQEKRL